MSKFKRKCPLEKRHPHSKQILSFGKAKSGRILLQITADSMILSRDIPACEEKSWFYGVKWPEKSESAAESIPRKRLAKRPGRY
jgi:hypothetical protein